MSDERVRRNELKIKPYFILSYFRKADDLRVALDPKEVPDTAAQAACRLVDRAAGKREVGGITFRPSWFGTPC